MGIDNDLDAHHEARLRLALAFIHSTSVGGVAMIATPRRIFTIAMLGVSMTLVLASIGFGPDVARAATIVPHEIQQPGTQPGEVGNLETPDKYDNCHGGYNRSVEPAFNWRGSMMANAGRDGAVAGHDHGRREPATRHPVF